MTKRMLIDASHAEETRVVVLDGNRLEDFDVETASRKQLKGNIYLAKVVRVEPSLQAAFVEYGGNRHGFLAFGEIHPDYYQIPVADRQRLLALQEEEARAEEEAEEASARAEEKALSAAPDPQPLIVEHQIVEGPAPADIEVGAEQPPAEPDPVALDSLGADTAPEAAEPAAADEAAPQTDNANVEFAERPPEPATMGGETEAADEVRERRPPSRALRSYKIQEVIRRRQILLVQVVKEERGTKGAALTTYISLAGRYCVLMPNSPRGGGISRKITSASDRRRLKEVTAELEIPRGMGVIVRTAGAARPKPEIKRDCEYLLRLWDDIRDQTMESIAPAAIYEEASLIKRAIRDVYSRDVDELIIDGEDGWRTAREFMRMLMPTHVKKVELWRNSGQPLFAHQNVEAMLDSMLSPTVQLRSGGYLVINQTEALVAIDVNSGRSTRERGIEETALRTNLEAAEEAARQLRLRDLAGLIVIDFIDMESKKHNAMVERRMSDALKNDRARIQVGHISHFGLMEISRQRLRPSLAETSLTICPHCGGMGHVRSTESAALHVLRAIEDEGGKRRAAEILVHVAPDAALYILNNKRQRLTEIEARYMMRVNFAADPALLPAQTRIDRLRAQTADLPMPETGVVQHRDDFAEPAPTEEEIAADADVIEEVELPRAAAPRADIAPAVVVTPVAVDPDAVPGETAEEGERRRKRRRRRRGRGRREDGSAPLPDGAEQPDILDEAFVAAMPGVEPPLAEAPAPTDPLPQFEQEPELEPERAAELAAALEPTPEPAPAPALDIVPVPGHDEAAEAALAAEVAPELPMEPPVEVPVEVQAEAAPEPPKRKRGPRRRKPREEAAEAPAVPDGAPAPYVGPTPANPYAAHPLDIFDVLDAHEQKVAAAPVIQAAPAAADPAIEKPGDAAVPIADETVPEEPGADDPGVSAIRPVLVGAAEPAERKRGWWKR
jgi:ribonuclease E